MDFERYYREKKSYVGEGLEKIISFYDQYPRALYDALRYVLFPGGKRIRACTVLLATEAAGGTVKHAVLPACAIELVHTYSLVHDDLPAMDNDDMRRGKPTCHREFDEATAILTGDAILTLAFEVLARAPYLNDATRVRLIANLAGHAGIFGMIGGQYMDLAAQGHIERVPTAAPLRGQKLCEYINAHKTAALFAAAFEMGAIVARADKKKFLCLSRVGYHIGFAFQMLDDAKDKQGFFTLYGAERCVQEAHRFLEEAYRMSTCVRKKDLILGLNRFILKQFDVA